MTRFNGVTRALSIPHPKPYSALAFQIVENWNHIDFIRQNSHSKILPKADPDGRILIIDYQEKSPGNYGPAIEALGKRVKVVTDVASFYDSVYSHSIPWALVGIDEAKANKNDKDAWYNKLDTAVQGTRRGETHGLPIGPATSAILAETILAKVDMKLDGHFDFHRYLDDYTAYCSSHEQAESFVLQLEGALAKYGLHLNPAKTAITTQPSASNADWYVDLNQALEGRRRGARGLSNFLDLAVRLSADSPDGSVLKYALTAAAGDAIASGDGDGEVDVALTYGMNWAAHNATLMPVISSLWPKALELGLPVAADENLTQLLNGHLRMRHYDAVAWLLCIFQEHNIPVPKSCTDDILASQDCIALLMLYLAGSAQQRDQVVSFCRGLGQEDLYFLDQYWLLLYQVFLDGKIGNPYKGDKTFNTLHNSGVNFVLKSEANP